MDDEQKVVPFYKRSSFRAAMIIWIILTVLFVLADKNYHRYEIMACNALSLFIIVMSWYCIVVIQEVYTWFVAAFFCYFAGYISVVGFWVSMLSHILFLVGFLHTAIFIVIGLIVGISKSVKEARKGKDEAE